MCVFKSNQFEVRDKNFPFDSIVDYQVCNAFYRVALVEKLLENFC